ncbi:MAG: hypothetical protein ACYC7D_10020 [Nitrososphaerales archaeon]
MIAIVQYLDDAIKQKLYLDINIPESVIPKLEGLKNSEKISILLYFAETPLSKVDCKKKIRVLQIPQGWWDGSNFERDLRKMSHLIQREKWEDDKTVYRLTAKGKNFVRTLLRSKAIAPSEPLAESSER